MPSLQGPQHNSGDTRVAGLAQRLPPEILIDVFLDLKTLAYLSSFPVIIPSDVRPVPLAPAQIAGAYYSLFAATLTCRAWCSVGTPFLYSCPALVSGYKVQRFKRSIESSPNTSRYLNEAIIVDLDRMNSIRSSTKPPFVNQARNEASVKTSILQILTSSQQLDTLTLSLQSHTMRFTPWLLRPHTSTARRLRKLTLYGQTLHSSFHNMELPVLQILCLRNFPYWDPRTSLPNLPRLQTLQIVSSFFDLRNAFCPKEKYPLLQTIELYTSDLRTFHIDVTEIHRFPPLFRLHLVGDDEQALFARMTGFEITLRISHLVLGVITDHFPPLSTWVFPGDLQSLTLFIRAGSTGALNTIRDCLVLNTGAIASSRFSELAIYISSCGGEQALVHRHPDSDEGFVIPEDEDGGLSSTLLEIRELCLSAGVEFECRNVDVGRWATKWLYGTRPTS